MKKASAVQASQFHGTHPVHVGQVHSIDERQTTPLNEKELAGPFSLIDRRPLAILTSPGTVLRIRSGSVVVANGTTKTRVVSGQAHRCLCNAVLELTSDDRAEMQVSCA